MVSPTQPSPQHACFVNFPRSFFPLSCPPPLHHLPAPALGSVRVPSNAHILQLVSSLSKGKSRSQLRSYCTSLCIPTHLHQSRSYPIQLHMRLTVSKSTRSPSKYNAWNVFLAHGGSVLLRHGGRFVDFGSHRVLDKVTDRFLVLSPLGVLAGAALVAPRLQLFTYLMCKDLDAGQWDPENRGTNPDMQYMGPTRPISCAADPVVQAKVAMFLTSLCHSITS